jgi:hypothetical protein
MPFADPRGSSVHGLAIGDVAALELPVDLVGERAQSLFTPREQDAPPAAMRKRPRDLGSDPGRRTGDDRDPDL